VITFPKLGLAAPILSALEQEGYTTPTPIQSEAIPPIIAGRDLLGIAQTGTGKTAAFALPLLHRLTVAQRSAPRHGCRVLVLSPTRELASQIAESFRTYGRHLDLAVATVFGGVPYQAQIKRLARGVDVLVATPGRLLDHLAGRNLRLDSTEVLVLDEVDQMLDLGFLKPIRRIVAALPSRRQSLFFSATMPAEIAALAGQLLRDPVKVTVAPASSTVERVAQQVIHVDSRNKRALLTELLQDERMSRTIVFTRTKRGADRVARHLEQRGIRVAAIHGNKSQRQREEALTALRGSRVRVLVATDIAARGLDVEQVSHVVNFELPEVPEAYVHRIGRTARAGAAGIAISLCDTSERGLLRDIERLTRQSIPSRDRRNDAKLEGKAASGGDRKGPHGKDRDRLAFRAGGGSGERDSDTGAPRGIHQTGRRRDCSHAEDRRAGIPSRG
jgi:ATP-dependent RNA helicase RhlE